MALDLVQIRALAERKEDENSRFRQFLKTRCNLEPDEIDQRVFETARRVWAGIDCTSCANCCRQMKPTFSEEEVDRVARRLGMEGPAIYRDVSGTLGSGQREPLANPRDPLPFPEK